MKKLKSKNVFQNSTKTNSLDLDKMVATSYQWWTYLKIIDGRLTFNTYRYSVTTSKHQRQTLDLLESMNVKVQVYINQRESL